MASTPTITSFPIWRLSDADAQAEAELKFTQTVLTYARHVQAGRFPYTRISRNNVELPQAPPEVADVLTKIADAADAAKALDDFSPPHAAYQELKAALAELRGADRRAKEDRRRSGRAQIRQRQPAWKMRACRCCVSV